MARSQPVVEGGAGGGGIRLGHFLALLRLFQRLAGSFQRGGRLVMRLLHRRQLAGVNELFQRERLFDQVEVADDLAAQADQKAGKGKRHQPKAPAEPHFRQTQGLAHHASEIVFSASTIAETCRNKYQSI
jgi:hypothetical protein